MDRGLRGNRLRFWLRHGFGLRSGFWKRLVGRFWNRLRSRFRSGFRFGLFLRLGRLLDRLDDLGLRLDLGKWAGMAR